MKAFINKYKHAWVFLYFVPYMIWYFGLQYIQTGFTDVYTSIDKTIPFVPWFIWIYIYWFLFVAGTIAYFFFKDRSDFYKCIAFLFIGMTVCLIVFSLFPTSYDHRPVNYECDSLTRLAVQIIYQADRPQNVFPSIHVYNSIGCAIAICKHEKFEYKKGLKVFSVVSAILITLSTMFVKQHSVLDALSASLLAIIMYVLVYVADYKGIMYRRKYKKR
jgi:PAP2 superfamily.